MLAPSFVSISRCKIPIWRSRKEFPLVAMVADDVVVLQRQCRVWVGWEVQDVELQPQNEAPDNPICDKIRPVWISAMIGICQKVGTAKSQRRVIMPKIEATISMDRSTSIRAHHTVFWTPSQLFGGGTSDARTH